MHHHHVLHEPGFFDLWRMDILMFSIIAVLAYLWWAGALGERFKHHQSGERPNVTAFITGVVLFYLVKGTPVDFYGHHYLFSAHMFQMAIVYLVVPPLLLLGLNDRMVRPIVQKGLGRTVFVFFTHPLISILLFNMVFSLYHLPYVFDGLMANHALHSVFHTVMLVGAILMWWPLMNLLPEYHRMKSGLRKIAYIFGSGVLLTPVCAIIIFAPNVIYETYRDVPQLFSLLPVLDDQQLGGVIMKVIQELTYMTAIAIIFFKWAKEERQKENQQDQYTLAYSRKPDLPVIRAVKDKEGLAVNSLADEQNS